MEAADETPPPPAIRAMSSLKKTIAAVDDDPETGKTDENGGSGEWPLTN